MVLKLIENINKKTAIYIIIFIGFLVYFNSLYNGFVWDDKGQILNNKNVHSIKNFFKFFEGSTFSFGASQDLSGLYYKPLMPAFFSLIYTVFKDNAFFFHLFQVIIHIINAILIFLFLRYFFKLKLSLILAIIFLVHPINVEAVSYISGLQDVLFLIFGMIAMFVAKTELKGLKIKILLFFLLICTLLSKETGILFFLIIFGYVFLFKKKNIKNLIFIFVLDFILYFALRFGIAKIFFQKSEITPIALVGFWERVINIPSIIIFYLKTFIFPLNLSTAHFWIVRSINFENFYLPLILVLIFFLLLVALGIYLKKDKRSFTVYLFFLTWFLIGLAFHLQLTPLDMTVSDRWFYFQFVGILGLSGLLMQKIHLKNKLSKTIGIVLLVLLIAVLSVRTVVRNSNWKDPITLYRHDLKVSSDNFELESLLGYELNNLGKYNEAKMHLERSIELFPNPSSYNNLGYIYAKTGDIDKSIIYFNKALRFGEYEDVYQNISYLMLTKKNILDARNYIKEKAIPRYPLNPILWYYLAQTEIKLGNKTDALLAAKQCYQIAPNNKCFDTYMQLLEEQNKN